MRISMFTVAMAILVTGLALLLVNGQSPSIVGLAPGDFASVVYLSIFGLMVASGLAFGRHRVNARLWHVAVWLAVFVALVVGYRWVHAPAAPPVAPISSPDSESV